MSAKKQIGDVRFVGITLKKGSKPYQVQKRTWGYKKDGSVGDITETWSYESSHERDQVLAQARAQAQQQHTTVRGAIAAHVAARRAANTRLEDQELRDRGEQRVRQVKQRLEVALRPLLDRPLRSITEADAHERYAAFAGTRAGTKLETIPRTGKPYRGNTVVAFMNESWSLFDWCQLPPGLYPADKVNPFERVTVDLHRNTGKDQPQPMERAALRAYVEQRLQTHVAYQDRRFAAYACAGIDLAALFIGVLLLTGCRPSELLRRRPLDIEPTADGAIIVVPKGKGKTKNAERRMQVKGPVGAALLRLRAARAEEQFLCPYRGKQWKVRAAKRVCAAAKVRYVVPYSHRGASVTAALREKLAPIAAQHGQGGPAVTERHYVDPSARIEVSEAQVLDHQAQLDRDSRATQLEAELDRLRQQGLMAAEPGALAIIASRLVAVLEAPPTLPGPVEPAPTARRSRPGRLN